MTDRAGGSQPTGPVESLVEAWGADMRAAEAAGERARTRSLRRQAAEDSDLRSVLADVADTGRRVGLGLRSGGRVTGVIVGVGSDFISVRSEAGAVLISLDAVVTVQATPGGPLPWPSGSRPPDDRQRGETFGGALSECSDGGRSVRLELVGGGSLTGELRLVARDFLIVRRAADGDDSYVLLDSIAAAWL